MIFYLNGAEHTSASRAANHFVYASDDPRLTYMGHQPHPENLPVGFGQQLRMALNASIINDAIPYSSNDRILRKTKEFLAKDHEEELFLMIMWAPWDRTEIHVDNRYYQMSGTVDLEFPKALNRTKKKFASAYDATKTQKDWHNIIWHFHKDLTTRGIKHLFGIESEPFDLLTRKHRWGDNFINPYNPEDTFVGVCNVDNSPDGDGFFFEKAHTSYMKYMIPKCVKLLT